MPIECDPESLAEASTCFSALSSRQRQEIRVYLICAAINGDIPVECSPESLAEAAKCFSKLSYGQLDQVETYLLCQLANGGGGGCPPTFETVADLEERLALTGLCMDSIVLQSDDDHYYQLVDADNPDLPQSWIDQGPRFYLAYDGGTFDQTDTWVILGGTVQYSGTSVLLTRDVTSIVVEGGHMDGVFHLDQFAATLTTFALIGSDDSPPTVSVAALVNLTTLELSNLGLTTIDSTGLTNLTVLDLSDNHLTSYNPSNHTALTMLNLGGNDLTSPPNMTALANLVQLSLDRNGSGLVTFSITANVLLILVKADNNSITTTVVNAVLADLVAAGQSGGTLTLQGQTPAAPPSGQGIVDVGTLSGNGWTVSTD
jgi:hypothetical protein